MCLLLETIRIENGRIRNLEYHNRRFNASRMDLFGLAGDADLASMITLPDELGAGVFRCRVLYRHEIERVEFLPHSPRMVRSLKLVHADNIQYAYKYADREVLESLFEMRGGCDDILIIRNGFVTDTSVGNIAFRKADGSWITPDTPLLKGTMRMCLLETGRIHEGTVRPEDLSAFRGAKMINCMADLDTGPEIEMDRIMT